MIVAGYPGPEAVTAVRLAEALGWPLVADPRSPAWVVSPVSVLHLDAILRSDQARDVLRPEVIVRFGAPGSSRVVNEWYAASGAEEIVVPGIGWSDPSGTAAAMLPGHPADVASAWLADLDRPGAAEPTDQTPGPSQPAASGARTGPSGTGEADGSVGSDTGSSVPARPDGWLALWQLVSEVAQRTVEEELARVEGHCEPEVARDVVAGMPAGAAVVVSSSMPIRDVERYATPREETRVLANRGANGIDGVVSTAVGAALATRRPTGLLLGDLAFLHDSNGLLGVTQRGIDLVCVVVDNDGGGIFSFLPQATQLATDRFELLFGTPHGLDLVALAAAYGVEARAIDPGESVEKAVTAAADAGGVHVLVVRTGRTANVEVHRAVDQAVASAVDRALAGATHPDQR